MNKIEHIIKDINTIDTCKIQLLSTHVEKRLEENLNAYMKDLSNIFNTFENKLLNKKILKTTQKILK